MEIQVSTQAWHEAEADWLVVGVPESPELSGEFAALDAALGGMLSRMVEAEDLTGKLAESLSVLDVPGIAANRLLAVGLGTDCGPPSRAMTGAVRCRGVGRVCRRR